MREDSTMRLSVIGLILILALGSFVAPLAAEAQPSAKVPRIGYVTDHTRPQSDVEALQHALRELGYIEGHNIAFAWRFAEKPEQYAALAVELVDLKVDVIVARTGFMTMAAQHATRTIPIVMVTSGDAVSQGIVASLAHPGGNVTGLTAISPDLAWKWLELLKEVVPELARVAVLRCPMVAGHPNVVDQFQWRELQGAAQALGLHLQSLEVRHPGDFEAHFAAAVRERADALVTLDCVYTNMAQTQVADLAATHRLPGMYFYRATVEAGGLMSYTVDWGGGQWRRVAVYVDKILKGAKPGDLPVEQPMKFELVINLKTAQALGLTIPPTLLFRADEVIK
jgi:putative tryptophan/tyrosine transport system substrate-binding protein